MILDLYVPCAISVDKFLCSCICVLCCVCVLQSLILCKVDRLLLYACILWWMIYLFVKYRQTFYLITNILVCYYKHSCLILETFLFVTTNILVCYFYLVMCNLLLKLRYFLIFCLFWKLFSTLILWMLELFWYCSMLVW